MSAAQDLFWDVAAVNDDFCEITGPDGEGGIGTLKLGNGKECSTVFPYQFAFDLVAALNAGRLSRLADCK